MSRLAFADRVAARLPLADAPAHIKQGRMSICDVLAVAGDGVGGKRVTLISKWRPSRQLRTKLKDHDFQFVWRPLSGISAKDLDAVSTFHLWHGTRAQGKTFLAKIWGRG